MVDPDTGFKRRQLYARRGTTDVLREKRKINITDMVQHDGPGYVSFKATGKNAEGRQEIAIGAHSIEGLRGEKLAAAVSTAETRAGRRLTLKFVGMGILDYTEVSDPVELKSNAQDLSLAPNATPPAFAPTVAPNAAPSAAVAPLADTVAQGLAEADAVGALAQKTWEAEQAKMRAEAPAGTSATGCREGHPRARQRPHAAFGRTHRETREELPWRRPRSGKEVATFDPGGRAKLSQNQRLPSPPKRQQKRPRSPASRAPRRTRSTFHCLGRFQHPLKQPRSLKLCQRKRSTRFARQCPPYSEPRII